MRSTIIYSSRSKIPRRIVISEQDADHSHHVQDGESGISVGVRVEHDDHARWIVAARHGVEVTTIPSGRCAIVDDNGIVVNLVMGDPAIDTSDAGKIIFSDTANVGDVWDGKTFSKPPA